MNEGGLLSARDSMKGNLREGSCNGGLEIMSSKARKWASVAIGAPLWGNMKGRFFLRTFLLTGIFMRFSRKMKKCPVKEYLSP